MRKIVLIFALMAIATTAVAKENPQKPSFSGFVSNKFWDNWELSGAAGVQTAFSNGSNLGSLGQRLGFTGDISVTKWIHPVVGLRLQFQGGYYNNYDQQYGKLNWPYLFVHTDYMVNLSNWIGGYRSDRVYTAIPFVGFGYMVSNFTDKSQQNNHIGCTQSFAVSSGLLNRFRLSPRVDFNIELKGLLVPSKMSPANMSGRFLVGLSATAGFTVRFNKYGWERGVAGYTAKDISAFQKAVADGNAALDTAKATNDKLSQELAAARAAAQAAQEAAAAAAAAAAQKAKSEKLQTLTPTSVILYDYGTSKLTGKEKTRLELMANVIKGGPKDKIYTIEGRADQQTGSAAGNKRVAENRAKRVYDHLIGLGVNPSQLAYEGKGNEANVEGVQQANRAVIIR